ncbi:MAG: type II toxin-antitoxin system HicA family toxin [bacterium]|jgi:predicted RNA binding protein YcfA (HicA-like mRNA interferase family)
MNAPLPVVTPKQVIKALQHAGFVIDHQTGSHVYLRIEGRQPVTVPYHNKDLKRGTLKSILRQAELTVEEFIELL